jgi:fibronectin-binding autotransporter adhesin
MSSNSRRIGRTNLVNSLRSKRTVAAFAVLASAVGMTARAATLTWDTNDSATSTAAKDGAGTWNTTTTEFFNGSGDLAWVNANNDTAQFGAGGAGALVTLTAVTAGGVSLTNATYTLTGGTLTLAGATPFLGNSAAAIVNSAVVASAGTSITAGAAMTMGGAITLNGATTFAANANATISGVIGGTGSLTKNGTQFLTMTAASTYTGGFTSNGGSVAIGSYGTASNNSALGAGTFTVTGSLSGGISFNTNIFAAGTLASNNAQVYGNVFNAATFFSSGNMAWLNMGTGPITFATFAGALGTGTGATFDIRSNGVLTLGGNISESTPGMTLTKTGTGAGGTLVLTGNNSFTGAVNLNLGTLRFSALNNLGLGTAINFANSGNGGTLQYAPGNTADISVRTVSINGTTAAIDTNGNNVAYANGIGNGSAGALTKLGDGSLALNGANTYTGATNVSRGTLALGPAGTLASATLNIASASFAIDPASAGQTFGATTLSGAAQISASFTGAGVLGLGNITQNVGGAMNITLPVSSSGMVTTSNNNATNGNGQSILAGWATVNKTDFAVSNGTNIAAFTGYVNNNFTTPTDGTPFNDVDVTGAAVTPSTQAGVQSVTVNSLRFNDAGGTTVSDDGSGDTLTVASGGILVTPNSGGVTFSQSTLNANGAPNNELIIHQYSNNPVVINSQINGGPLTKVGPGAITLGNTGGNSFSGLNIDGGTVSYAADNQLGGNVTFNGATLSYTGTGNINLTRALVVDQAGAGINISQSGAGGGGAKVIMSSANITGPGTITLSGIGILSMTTSQTGYQGAGWIINGGTLEDAASAGTTSLSTTGLGTFNVPVTVNPGGELAIKVSLPNPLTLNGGTIGEDTATTSISYSGAINVTANSQFRLGIFFSGNNNFGTITGPISGSGNLTLINAPSPVASSTNPNPGPNNTPSLQTFQLLGNNSQFTGTLVTDAGHDVRFVNPIAIMPTLTKSTPTALPVVAIQFNTVANGNGLIPTLSNDPQGTDEGVFGPTGGINSNQSFNMAAIAGGNWYFGTDSAGTSYFGVLSPGNGNVYRLAGGGGNLFIGSNSLPNATANVLVGDTRLGGTGTIRYGTKMTYGGSTTINAGSTLAMDFVDSGANQSDLMPTGSALTMNGGVFAATGKASNTNVQHIGSLILNPGSASIQANGNATSNPLSVIVGALTRNSGGTVDFTSTNSGVTQLTNGNVSYSGALSASILGGYATVGGMNWAVSAGDGTTPGNVTALGTYDTTFDQTAAGADVDAPAAVSTPGTITINSLRFNGGGQATVADSGGTGGTGDTLTVASGGILETTNVGNNAVTLSTVNLTSGNGQDLVVIQNNLAANAPMTITSVIADNGASTIGLTKSGVGGLALTAADTFHGLTSINGGVLTIENSLALQNSTVYATLQGGSMNFSTLTAVTLGGLSGNQTVSLTSSSGAVALDVGSNGQSTTYAGNITGSGSVNKSGTGTLVLAGSNSYAGGTTVASGALQLGNGTGTGTIVGKITNNGAVAFAHGDNFTFGGTISGTGSVSENGPGTTILAANNSYAGGTTINGGTLSVASDAKLGQAGTPVTLNGGTLANTAPFTLSRTLTITANSTISAGADLSIINDLTSPASLTKSGAGKLTVPSFKLGGLNVAAGSMAVSSNGGLNTVNSLTVGDNTSATAAQLDLNNNDLVVSYTTTSPAATIGALLTAGYNGGAWNGNGIASSAAASHPGQALGYGDAADLGITSIDGNPIAGNAVIVKYTYAGDASLDGKVDLGNDLDLFLTGYLTPGATGWDQGDFNYDGTVNNTDFGLLIDGLVSQGTPLGQLDAAIEASPLLSAAQKANLLSVVPEPSTMAVLAMAGAGLMTRRRRK